MFERIICMSLAPLAMWYGVILGEFASRYIP